MKYLVKTFAFCLATGWTFGFGGTVSFAETKMTWRSSGVSFVVAENHQMADGSISQIASVKFVATASDGDFNGQTWSGACYGHGMITATGDYSGVWPCDANFSAEDSLTFVLTDNPAGGETVITGGKGKFKGATGGGKLTYTWGDSVGATLNENFVTWTDEVTITLP